MATVTPEQKLEFTRIIDAFLRSSDLTTVSQRSVRAHLQEVVGYDLTPIKGEIKDLITERFDEILTEQDGDDDSKMKKEAKSEHCATDGTISGAESITLSASSPATSQKMAKTSSKRKHDLDHDAKLAAKLHEELNSGRPSRSATSANKKKIPPKKRPKKSKPEIDSDISADETSQPGKKKRAINRNNPFNAPMQLSEALSDLIGKTECSRPECVKSIWAYVKEHGLQDPNDKRYIICDDSMKRVFNGASRVHMFTMNKYLSSHIFPLQKNDGDDAGVEAEEEGDADAEIET
ncbi:hypothetical protein BDZ91DRAFT_722830 [Kalaharituber pfeilii]|nr:hypothetical protein BDZ91DRAFT_722830 [Kalaharituber pfeilii]